ncbi:MAG: class I SAM-dependent methyltransferase [Verrucomicrobiota bacterium]|jgi:SAM-dependent methyltransferase
MKSNLEWKKWGERDPLYAVSTWKGKERGAPNAWTDEEFYQLGRSDWSDFLRQWQQYGVNPGTCVEIGCGAGRITKQLVECFQHVTALDVSQHQLDYARQHIPASTVTFTLSDGTRLPMADQACDAVFSVHVFQHFESHEDAFSVFRDIYRILKPGGTLMIHLPLYDLPDTKISILFPPVIAFAKRLSDLKAAVDRRSLRKGNWKPVMRRLRFDRHQLVSQLEGMGFSRVEVRMFPVGSIGGHHEFVFATKAG